MAKKKSAKKTRTVNQQLSSFERLVRSGFRQSESRSRQVDKQFGLVHLEFRELRKEMNERFAVMEDRIDRLAAHVDGFMKLHETMDFELRVMKEQMNRFEERLKRIEVAQTS